MKKHPFIQIEFHSTVKLTAAQSKKISLWFSYASLSIEKLLKTKGIIHPQWLSCAESVRVSVMLCGESKIKKLNRDHRKKDKITDVLSFPAFNDLRRAPSKREVLPRELFLGDLAICHQKTAAQAREFKITYWDEFIHLFMHGMIHLMGFDHEISVKEEKIMQRWENEALDILSIIKKGPN